MNRTIGVGFSTLAVAGLLTAAAIAPAQAGSKGRKNTSAVLAGVAAYELLKGNTTAGVVAGAGAAVAYGKYKDARDDERRYDRYRYDDRSYDRRYDRSDYRDYRTSPDYRDDRYRRTESYDRYRYDDRSRDRYSSSDPCPNVYRDDSRRYDGARYDSSRYDGRYSGSDRNYYLNRDSRRGERCEEERGSRRR